MSRLLSRISGLWEVSDEQKEEVKKRIEEEFQKAEEAREKAEAEEGAEKPKTEAQRVAEEKDRQQKVRKEIQLLEVKLQEELFSRIKTESDASKKSFKAVSEFLVETCEAERDLVGAVLPELWVRATKNNQRDGDGIASNLITKDQFFLNILHVHLNCKVPIGYQDDCENAKGFKPAHQQASERENEHKGRGRGGQKGKGKKGGKAGGAGLFGGQAAGGGTGLSFGSSLSFGNDAADMMSPTPSEGEKETKIFSKNEILKVLSVPVTIYRDPTSREIVSDLIPDSEESSNLESVQRVLVERCCDKKTGWITLSCEGLKNQAGPNLQTSPGSNNSTPFTSPIPERSLASRGQATQAQGLAGQAGGVGGALFTGGGTAQFWEYMEPVQELVQETVLTDKAEMVGMKPIRRVKVGEKLLILDVPREISTAGGASNLLRVHVRTLPKEVGLPEPSTSAGDAERAASKDSAKSQKSDGEIGWITVRSNQGALFLRMVRKDDPKKVLKKENSKNLL